MQVKRLRLAGFKSFVEPTELAIEPGLTGVVGPNGCGKSNLVEALRWVMGEGSARRLRGGEMDDVIFAGSAGRPARNLAEVVLTLDGGDQALPFGSGSGGTIEVARRIVRGGGSLYRVNGREARAHDVQLLFADAATGAHSAAMVGQGRIGALLAARPVERRLLLDEAAGTTGLHARRHEAELKLRAAEENLLRLDDVMVTLAAQLDGLRKQARQAQRYRRLGEQVRRTEAQLLGARWRAAAAEAEALASEARAGERALAAATETALAARRTQTDAETALPPLRMAAAAAAAAMQRMAHAREALEQELARVRAARDEAERRLAQLAADLGREAAHLADAEKALAGLASEEATLKRAGDAAARGGAEATERAEAAAAELAIAENGLHQMTEACAAGEARRGGLDRQRRDTADRQTRLRSRLAEAEAQRVSLLRAALPPEAADEAAIAVAQTAAAIDAARTAAADAAETLAARRQQEALATDAAREATGMLARAQAEAEALVRIVGVGVAGATADPTVLSLIEVSRGFEAAVAALFDGELAAPPLSSAPPPDSDVSSGWVPLPPLAASELPSGARPIAGEIGAPAALARRLESAGWVETAADGWRLQPLLAPGQSLVDRGGRLWRWDGFVRLAGNSAADAELLRRRNRLAELSSEIACLAEEAGCATERETSARAAREAATAAERDAAGALRAAEERHARARVAEAEVTRHRLAAESRLAAAAEVIERLGSELAELDKQAADIATSLRLLPDPGLARTALEAARAQAVAVRRREADARAALDRLPGEAANRRQRLAAIAAEATAWRQRRDAALTQRTILAERRDALAAEITELDARPAAIAREGDRLAGEAEVAAARRSAEEDALAAGETRLRHASDAARHAEAAVAEIRERRAAIQARYEAAAEAVARLRGEIADRLGQTPEALPASTAADDADRPADLAASLERLIRERDAIGPVNLLAEREAAEVEERLSGLTHERADLTAAIARLRRGIATLDDEGRKRLAAAFEVLNTHFGELFERLFGGGKAELGWVGDDDPLLAGLDIMASPPGKRRQALSLLSGGEQALTAIALIFAAFLTNPAPICVLDEVDAPLDDANVDSFCRLVADIADTTGTRFLLVTHHRVTMARMDRLFGVTMAERGVSQLVSVDLARAAELRQSA